MLKLIDLTYTLRSLYYMELGYVLTWNKNEYTLGKYNTSK